MVKQTGQYIGEQFGNYQLVQFLGDGAFAEVYRGKHIRMESDAAIKIPLIQLNQEDKARFIKEAQILAKLVHPNIVRIFDVDEKNGIPFLVMDYASNGSLLQRHPKEIPLPPTLILIYVKQIASALQYVHNNGQIHCDVKPANMLLGAKNEILLSDFGLSEISRNTRSLILRADGGFGGTPSYIAPEQIHGMPRQASDQYALGVVVYEWLCGQLPFISNNWNSLCYQHEYKNPPSLCEKLPVISEAIENVVLKALAKDPHHRFASINDFAEALYQAYYEQPYVLPGDISEGYIPLAYKIGQAQHNLLQTISPAVTSVPDSQIQDTQAAKLTIGRTAAVIGKAQQPPTSNVHKTSRRGAIAWLIVVSSGVVVGGAGLTMYLNHTFASSPPSTNTSVNQPVGVPIFVYSASGDVKSLSWSPDSTYIASVAGSTVDVWKATTKQNVLPSPYSQDTQPVKSVMWSPNGQYIVSGSEDNTVHVWHAFTGKDVGFSPYTKHTAIVRSVAWSPNGQWIVSGSEDNTVHVWDATTGYDRAFSPYRGHTSYVIGVAWSPDSRKIASASFDTTVRVWDASTGQDVLQPLNHPNGVRGVAWSPDGRKIASGGDDNIVYIWNATTKQQPQAFSGHKKSIQSVAWSPDGDYIASGSFDKTVKIWEVATGKNVFTYTHHTGQVWTAMWSPSGQFIASGDVGTNNDTVQIWRPL